MDATIIESIMQMGVAGLMGLLWVWERMHSRKRERQLSEAHAGLMQNQEHLGVLVRLVRQNTAAVERFDQTQRHLHELLERMRDELVQADRKAG